MNATAGPRRRLGSARRRPTTKGLGAANVQSARGGTLSKQVAVTCLLFLLPLFGCGTENEAPPTPPPDPTAGGIDAEITPRSHNWVALLVGNDDYDVEPWGELRNAVNDVELIGKTLKELHVDAKVETDLNEKEFMAAIKRFKKRLRKAGDRAVGFFYYAGHGVQEGATNYLIPVEESIGEKIELEAHAVKVETVMMAMEDAGSQTNILILDACRNLPPDFQSKNRSMKRGLGVMATERSDESFEFFIAYSTGADKVAFDGKGDNSPFAEALAAVMDSPGMELQKSFRLVGKQLKSKKGLDQKPWHSQSVTDTLYWSPEKEPNPPPATEQVVRPPIPVVDPVQEHWEQVEASGNIDVVQQFILQNPSHALSGGAANARLGTLIGNSSNRDELQQFLDGYPESPQAPNARRRLDALKPRQPFTVVVDPATARIRILDIQPPYRPGMALPPRQYKVEATAEGYAKVVEMVPHGTASPTIHHIKLDPIGSPAKATGRPHPTPDDERQVGEKFADCEECPQMVVVPAGTFLMGSPEWHDPDAPDQGGFLRRTVRRTVRGAVRWGREEMGRLHPSEGPAHTVKIALPLAVGIHEVTFAEWDACAASKGGCKQRPIDEGWGRGNQPVIHVNWNDAQAYVQWLSHRTGKRYRLLSESEWEYAARGGTKTRYHTGQKLRGHEAHFKAQQTHTVGAYVANHFGLHDMHGNVWEWTQDCWNDNYKGAPDDGTAWESGDCNQRVKRGGSWQHGAPYLRSALRHKAPPEQRLKVTGFRVARDLSTSER